MYARQDNNFFLIVCTYIASIIKENLGQFSGFIFEVIELQVMECKLNKLYFNIEGNLVR